MDTDDAENSALMDQLMRSIPPMDLANAEKLLREVGYHAISGSCSLGEKKLIILDRDLPVKDQVDLLADEIRKSVPDPTAVPPHLKKLL